MQEQVSVVEENSPSVTAGEVFQEFIVQLHNGEVLEQLGESMKELVAAVNRTAKPGQIVLTMKVAPNKGSGELVSVDCNVKKTLPQPSHGPSFFFARENGLLSRDNPKQIKMFQKG